jgi:hypothetical protein
MKKLLIAVAVVPLFLSCSPFSGPLPGVMPPTVYVQHVTNQGEFPFSVDLSSNTKSVFFAFDNPDPDRDASNKPEVTGLAAARGLLAPSVPKSPSMAVTSRVLPTPTEITEFNRDPFKGRRAEWKSQGKLFGGVPPKPLLDTVGQTNSGQSDIGGQWDTTLDYPPEPFHLINAICRAVEPLVDIGGDTRTLNIWVADNCWDDEIGPPPTGKAFFITQAMVDAVKQKFLTSGLFNDIYDWVTSMVGSEWGNYTGSDPTVITFNKEITILLCDIAEDDSPDGGIVGFFWAKDNFDDTYVYEGNTASPYYFPIHSNQRIMFYIDAVMFANPNPPGGTGGTWSSTGYWAEEIYSTLAHEFQHMINFNQKIFVKNSQSGTDTWINEMCSQAIEDLVSDKLAVIGPRGVDGNDATAGSANNGEGRIPLFNAYPYVSLTDWGGSGTLQSYSASYAFGAYLLRNYGGAALMKAMVQDAATDSGQIVDAVSAYTGKTESLSALLQRWSAAVLLSDHTDAPAGYVYNTGDFFDSSVGTATYRLGSMNFFNYHQYGSSDAGPILYSGNGAVGDERPLAASGTLYLAGADVMGKREWLVNLPNSVILTVVVK